MRIAVAYGAMQYAQVKEIASAISAELQKYGYFVDLINCHTDRGTRLTGYHYVVVVSHSTSFFKAALPPSVLHFLPQAGVLTGKRSAAILVSRFQFSLQKALHRLMKCMEQQGMILHCSEILSSRKQVPAFIDTLKGSLEKK